MKVANDSFGTTEVANDSFATIAAVAGSPAGLEATGAGRMPGSWQSRVCAIGRIRRDVMNDPFTTLGPPIPGRHLPRTERRLAEGGVANDSFGTSEAANDSFATSLGLPTLPASGERAGAGDFAGALGRMP